MKIILKNKLLFLKDIVAQFISYRFNSDVRYTIIDITNDNTIIWLQCLQTNKVFFRKIESTNIDLDIIGKLLPEQACFWGIMIGKLLIKESVEKCYSMELIKRDFFLYASEAAGHCKTIIIDRGNNFIFTHPKTKEVCSMQAFEIASDGSLISLFHPSVACFIGIYVESKRKERYSNLKTKGYLRLVS